MKRFLLILSCLTVMTGCIRDLVFDNDLLKTEQVCLKVGDRLVYSFDETRDQLGYNAKACQFRAGSDNMGEFIILTCDTKPVKEGQSVDVVIQWTEKGTVARRTRTMKVEKISDNGYVWLWYRNRKERICAVVRVLE